MRRPGERSKGGRKAVGEVTVVHPRGERGVVRVAHGREAIALSAVVPTPAPRRADDSRVILAHTYCQASQAIVSSYMMGTWVAWHIRRRP
jgi:hypothetical protein